MKRHPYIAIIPLLLFLLGSCADTRDPAKDALFRRLDVTETGIDFRNDLKYDATFNIYTYRNFYNGGGVAIGDVNGDSLVDIYFTANMGPNRLYLNKGDFRFEDITEAAGVAGNRAWSTGVSMADVNGDGLLDIYVCNSGDVQGDNKQNELFLNNGDLTFTEAAEDLGVADRGYSTHAAFFDYDRDGDLDLYLLNNSYQAIGSFNLRKNERPVRDEEGGDKLFRNDGDHFTDVSEEAGIYGSVIGFGLGVTVGDLNLDGWQDLFISNDFFERDYLYMNNGDGSFSEVLEQQIKSLSAASMGADMADIDNNGYPDIFVTEMLPESNVRLKSVTTFENWDKYTYNVENGYYHQFTRNVLHLNNRNGTYSEIGRLAGVEATDWSWGALIFDMNNDGFKDIFVANGIYQDLTDQDYLNFISNEETMKSIISQQGVDYQSLIDAIPSNAVSNYAFENQGRDYRFENRASDWGLDEISFSNGSAYGDLDNDGDLDLVVNNVNMEAFIYRNRTSETTDQNWLKVILAGAAPNTFALGSKVYAVAGPHRYYMEQMPVRGFESTVDHRINLGLGKQNLIDTLMVIWPDQRTTLLTDVNPNQTLVLDQRDAKRGTTTPPFRIQPKPGYFEDITAETGLEHEHRENPFIDFDRDKLLYHMRSNEGPAIATADVDGDGLEDLFIGGSRDTPASLYLQKPTGMVKSEVPAFEADKLAEDVDATFFDANGDTYPDLYVASGSNDFSSSSGGLKDRLYFNDGRGSFSRSEQALPGPRNVTSGTVSAGDFDMDGDQDLFVGERLKPYLVGVPGSGFLLENDGTGKFTDITEKKAPELIETGMITDSEWVDIDNDGDPDLVIVGEYMPIRIFLNTDGRLVEDTEPAGLGKTNGWWLSVHSADMDGDGDIDLIAGNHGLNSRFRASEEKPIVMYINDFDRNGDVEQIVCRYEGDSLYPLVLKHDLVNQIPSLKKEYLKYAAFRDKTVDQIFSREQLDNALELHVYTMASSFLENKGDGTFEITPLPVEAQFAPMYAAFTADFDNDGNTDILMGGNQYRAKPEVGRYDASYGVFLKGNGQGDFSYLPPYQSGFLIDGEVRGFSSIQLGDRNVLLAARNNGPLVAYAVKQQPGEIKVK